MLPQPAALVEKAQPAVSWYAPERQANSNQMTSIHVSAARHKKPDQPLFGGAAPFRVDSSDKAVNRDREMASQEYCNIWNPWLRRLFAYKGRCALCC